MILLQFKRIEKLEDAIPLLQMAIGLEFSTLPPYLYALYSIKPDTNAEASSRIKMVVQEEMIHMCLGCNILNALGTNPALTAPKSPGPLPGGITGGGKQPLIIHLLPFSKDAMAQAMSIEEPEDGAIDFPHELVAAAADPDFMTIGHFYSQLDNFLKTLPASKWSPGHNQIDDSQFFPGELFAVNGYADAHNAIQRIESEGEGSKDSPLDFQGEVAHYYRFAEVFYDQVLTKANNPKGYAWIGKLGVDWNGVYPAIADPEITIFPRTRRRHRPRRINATRRSRVWSRSCRRRSPGKPAAWATRCAHVRSAHGGQACPDRSAGRVDPSGRPELPLSPRPHKGGCAMSVLETPRLVFRGQLSWDPITTNNYSNLYDENDSKTIFDSSAADVAAFRKEAIADVISQDQTGADYINNWNPDGTHRATYYDTTVTGVDTGKGLSADDPIVKCPVSFLGMLVDLEPSWQRAAARNCSSMPVGSGVQGVRRGLCSAHEPHDHPLHQLFGSTNGLHRRPWPRWSGKHPSRRRTDCASGNKILRCSSSLPRRWQTTMCWD